MNLNLRPPTLQADFKKLKKTDHDAPDLSDSDASAYVCDFVIDRAVSLRGLAVQYAYVALPVGLNPDSYWGRKSWVRFISCTGMCILDCDSRNYSRTTYTIPPAAAHER